MADVIGYENLAELEGKSAPAENVSYIPLLHALDVVVVDGMEATAQPPIGYPMGG